MLYFFTSIIILIVGYFVIGKFLDRISGINPERKTPVHEMEDGVDYVPMSTPKIFLIQLLNIAGLGPIYGPILGALYGPSALLWIVLGALFAGGIHDYFCGFLSVRNKGVNIPEIVGKYMGNFAKQFMNIFSTVGLILVSVVFVLGPAKLLGNIFDQIHVNIWIVIIFIYYFLATILPINKIIGRVYPIFGFLLVFMAVSLILMLFVSGNYEIIPSKSFANTHPKNLPIWPLMFITIACGAISGFHSTQSPLMARCVKNEKTIRKVFYGAMLAEAAVALIWATLGMSFYYNPIDLQETLTNGGPSAVVKEISETLLGGFGGLLAVLGVIILPITTGDTCLRSARIIVSEFLKFDQKKIANRLIIAIPLFVIGFFVALTDFEIMWRYFGWSNQTLSVVTFWAIAVYMFKYKNKYFWIALLPAMFMTAVSISFILSNKIGFGIDIELSKWISISVSLILGVIFLYLGYNVWNNKNKMVIIKEQ